MMCVCMCDICVCACVYMCDVCAHVYICVMCVCVGERERGIEGNASVTWAVKAADH